MAKVSIIIPIYNVELYLDECLDSIINQSLQDIEIICVNDGSTDSCLDILTEYAQKDKRIVIINKKNTGYGHSMNIGISHATGDYIGIVESDDFVELSMFERLYIEAINNKVEVVKSNYFEYRTLEGIQECFYENLVHCQYNKVFKPIDDLKIFYVICSIWSGIYERNFLINNKIHFLETPGASYQDTSFAFQVWLSAKKVYLVKDAFVHYRMDNTGSSMNKLDKTLYLFNQFEKIECLLNLQNPKNDKLIKLAIFIKYRTYKYFYNILSANIKCKFYLHVLEEAKSDYEKGLLSSIDFENIEWEEEHIINSQFNVVRIL
ncbi:MAG: glycosyltransferase family 2 protein [Mobilitalea sp.]